LVVGYHAIKLMRKAQADLRAKSALRDAVDRGAPEY
jgi:hypothetical protein